MIRAATTDDLPTITHTWVVAEGDESGEGLPVPSVLEHLRETGRMLVAEHEGEIIGFSSACTRDGETFLAQMFILPGWQSAGVGRALLQAIMPDDGTIRSTIASADPRAVSLYARHGMAPQWPMYDLSVAVSSLRPMRDALTSAVRAEPGDPELVRLDATVCGRERREDHAYWMTRRAAEPYWIEHAGTRCGYAYIQVLGESDDAAIEGDCVRVGPVGTLDSALARDCVLTAVNLARERGARLKVLAPGPHAALVTLLDGGFRVDDPETYLSSAVPPRVDPGCYIPSGGGLF